MYKLCKRDIKYLCESPNFQKENFHIILYIYIYVYVLHNLT